MSRPRVLLASGLALVLAVGALGCTDDRQLREGDQLYADLCARCHGANGQGDPRSVQLYPRQNLTRSGMIERGDRILIRDRIVRGYGLMPGYQFKLQPEEVGRLVNKCLEFGKAKPGGTKG